MHAFWHSQLHIYPSAPHPGGPEFYTAEGGGPAYGRLYVDDYNSFKYLHGDFLYEGFAYKQEEEEKEEKGAEQETSSSSTPLKAKTWTLRSTALPLELLDSAHDEPLQGRYRNFPHSESKRDRSEEEEERMRRSSWQGLLAIPERWRGDGKKEGEKLKHERFPCISICVRGLRCSDGAASLSGAGGLDRRLSLFVL